MRWKKEYALYKGDDLLKMGTKGELALFLGVSVSTISFYKSPAYKRRIEKSNNRLVVESTD